MRYLYFIFRLAMLLVMILASSCARVPVTSIPTETTLPTSIPLPTEMAVPSPTTSPTKVPTQKEFEDFNPNNFDQSTSVDNKWLPLKPGTQWSYEGFTVDNGAKIPHRLVVTVTDLTKVINGVNSVVTWDQDFKADQLTEGELAFFAQDKNGTVWRMGEHPEAYEDGTFIEAPTWFTGIEDAKAGIEMQGAPQLGMPSYSEGWGPSVDFTDRGQVSQMGQMVCVPSDCYNDVLVIDETSKAEPGAHQLKYFASGIGNIRVAWTGADQTQETLELIKVVQLTPDALIDVRAKALELEKHAYLVSKDVYGLTPPSQPAAGN